MNKYKYCADCPNESDSDAKCCEACGSVNFEIEECELTNENHDQCFSFGNVSGVLS